MTRNEYIAETAVRFYTTLEFASYETAIETAIKAAVGMANEVERLGVAPWKDEVTKTDMNAASREGLLAQL